MHELSFYSQHHGGTFHFLQLNVLHADEFISSPEYKHLLDFLMTVYNDDEDVKIKSESMEQFFKSLEHKKMVIDLKDQ